MSEDLVSIKRNGKNFKIQPLEHFEKIQKEVLAWILEKDLYKEWIVDNSRFHKSGTCDMPVSVLDSLPYTKKAIEELGEPTRLTFWITRGEDTLPCHVDGGFEHFWVPRSRLLIPVVNYTDTTTIFYSKNVKLENFQDTGGVSYLRPIDPTQFDTPVNWFPLLHAGSIVPGIAVAPPLNMTYYGKYYIETGLSVDLASKANQATTYTITEADTRLSGKQNTLIFKDPTQLDPLVPLLRAGTIVPGIAVVPPLNITYYGND
jgi:hypothetical protein